MAFAPFGCVYQAINCAPRGLRPDARTPLLYLSRLGHPHHLHMSLPAQHPVSVLYLDETGRVGRDDLFGVGVLKVADHSDLMSRVRALRMAQHAHGELQWKRLDKSDYPAAAKTVSESILRLIAQPGPAHFAAVFDDGRDAHLRQRYGDKWKAYEALATDAICRLIDAEEVVTVLADRYTPPQALGFEATVRAAVNARLGRLAVTSLVRLKSSSTDGLQLVDLLLGAVAFDFRYPGQTQGLKGRLAAMVRELHEVPSYRPRGRQQPDWYSIEYRGGRRGRRGGRGRMRP